MKRLYKILLSLVFIGCITDATQAQLIFSEPFDYPAGNLQAANKGTGFSSPWSRANTDAAATLGDETGSPATVQVGSINTANGAGNKVKFCVQNGKSTRLDRALTTRTLDGADGTVYWLSFWYNNSLSDTSVSTQGTAAQLILMDSANNASATEMRLGFGKTSNITGANYFTVFTRASPTGCAAQNWGQNIMKSSTGTYFVLVKITKGEFSIRVWLSAAPPANEAALATRPDGDLTPLNATTNAPEAIQTKVLRADNNSNTTCVRSGISGIRLRVEGGTNTSFCPEFDELKMGTTFASVTSRTLATKDFELLAAQISPNPAKDKLTISLEEEASKAVVTVYDVLGKKAISSQFSGVQTELGVSSLAKGMYIIQIQTGAKMKIQKFVKE
jgi:Secretion system C-terminal sorting domain